MSLWRTLGWPLTNDRFRDKTDSRRRAFSRLSPRREGPQPVQAVEGHPTLPRWALRPRSSAGAPFSNSFFNGPPLSSALKL